MSGADRTPLENDFGTMENSCGEGDRKEHPPTHLLKKSWPKDYGSSFGGVSSHCHTPMESPPRDSQEQRQKTNQWKLIIASILCLIFMTGETVGGIAANSLAILTDAAHLLTDFAAFMISLFTIHMALKKPSKKYSFGWHRAEIVGALLSIMLLWLVTGIVVFCAIQRFANDNYHLEPKIMLITAGCGVVINLIMALVLFLYKPGQLHGHSHGFPASKYSDTEHLKRSVVLKAAVIHVLGDMIQSIGVVIAAIIVFIHPKAKIADPLCTVLFSAIVMFSTFTVLRDIFRILMEGVPEGLQYNNVESSLLGVPGVQKLHNLRIWSLSLDRQALAVHLVSDGSRPTNDVLQESQAILRDGYGLDEATVQIEMYSNDMDTCLECAIVLSDAED